MQTQSTHLHFGQLAERWARGFREDRTRRCPGLERKIARHSRRSWDPTKALLPGKGLVGPVGWGKTAEEQEGVRLAGGTVVRGKIAELAGRQADRSDQGGSAEGEQARQ